MVNEATPWQNRFQQPTTRELRKGLPSALASIFDEAQTYLISLEGIVEQVDWYGASWRWSIEYRPLKTGDPLVVLIPSPEDLQLAMPVDPEFLESLPMRRLKRSVRDGLDLAREPFDTRWAVWSIHFPGVLDDIKDLIRRRCDYLRVVKR